MKNDLRKLRLQRSWSQRYVAQVLNVTQMAVCKWENGHTLPRPRHLKALEKLFTPDKPFSQAA